MTSPKSVFFANPKVIISNPKLTNTKLTLNPNLILQTSGPSPPHRYYSTTVIIELRIIAIDGDDAALPASFARVCFVKFICFTNVSNFIL